MKRKLHLLLALISATFAAEAQISLEECLQLAAENYPVLKKYDLIDAATDFTIDNAKKGYLPQLTFYGEGTYQSDVAAYPDAFRNFLPEGYEIGNIKKTQYKVGLNLNQVIYDGGNISSAKELAAAEGDTQSRQADVEMYAIRSRVNSLFFSVLLMEERIKLNEDLQALLADNCRKIDAMVTGGIAMQCDAESMKAEYLTACQNATELQSTRNAYLRMLEIFTGQKINTSLAKPDAQMPENLEPERPELRLYESQKRYYAAQLKKINAGIMPQLSLFAQGYYGYPGLNMFEAMMEHKMTLNGIVGLKLTWNIGNFYTLQNNRRKIDTQISIIDNAKDVFLFNNTLQNTEYVYAIEHYEQTLADDDKIIALRNSVRTAAEAKLEHGVIDVNDLIQEINRENKARIDRSTHEIEMLKNIYELKNNVNK
ncbi:MAG: TolC family protein [Muribaculaceae bacterium]